MNKKQQRYVISGMNQDLNISKGDNKYSFENKNIRITVNEGSDFFSITSEASTEPIVEIRGHILGHCEVDNRVVIFHKEGEIDYISLFDGNTLTTLYKGHLNFNFDHLIESTCNIETDSIKRVYWTDGINLPRSINIEENVLNKENTYFDSVVPLSYSEQVTITMKDAAEGLFPSGTIQYVCTYVRNSTESGIFYTSPLYNLTNSERGASPEDTVRNVFNITISNIDTSKDKIKIYSVQRTSKDAIALVYLVKEIKINGTTYSFTDDNTNIATVDPTILHYIGSDNIIPYTLEHKDGTMFYGNYKLDRKYIDYTPSEITVEQSTSSLVPVGYSQTKLSQEDTMYFKKGEYYDLGVVFVAKSGKKSNPIYLTREEGNGITIIEDPQSKEYYYKKSLFNLTIPKDLQAKAKAAGYTHAIPIVGIKKESDRRIICQGVLNPSMYQVGDRKTNSPYAQSSWFFRPNPADKDLDFVNINNIDANIAEYRHDKTIGKSSELNGEIMNYEYDDYASISYNNMNSWSKRKNRYAIDRSIVSMYSPDIDNVLITSDVSISIIGTIPIDSFNNESIVNLKTAPFKNSNNTFSGIKDFKVINTLGGRSYLGSPIFYEDGLGDLGHRSIPLLVYPFHNTGGLGERKGVKDRTAELDNKKWLNYRYSEKNNLFSTPIEIDVESYANIDNIDEEKNYELTHKGEKVFYRNITDKVYTGQCLDFDQLYWSYKADTERLDIPMQKGKVSIKRSGIYQHDMPVSIKYKNYKHIALSLKDSILPQLTYRDETFRTSNSIEELFSKKGFIDSILQSIRNFSPNYTSNPPYFIAEFPISGYDLHEYKSVTEIINNHIQEYLVNKISTSGDIEQVSSILSPTESSYNTLHINRDGEPEIISHKVEENTLYVTLKFREGTSNYKETLSEEKADKYKDFVASVIKGIPDIEESKESILKSFKDEYYSLLVKEKKGFLLLGDLINNKVPKKVSKEFKHNIDWEEAGPISPIGGILQYRKGDTYYQRFTCIGTTGLKNTDPNQVIDVLSFMVETRTNLELNYSRNKNNNNFINSTFANTNLFNPAYNQSNNFFPLVNIEDVESLSYDYPSRVTWTKQKNNGETVDMWQHITGISFLDLKGSLGKLNNLSSKNNEIIAFQDKGICQIAFNSRVQIPVTDGVPIEISNSYKVQGYNYYSEFIGCQNKFSIITAKTGILFLDNNSDTIYLFSDSLLPLSEKLGFRTYVRGIKDKTLATTYNTATRSFYDNYRGDLYIVNDRCLSYSSSLSTFESFFDYEQARAMFNIKDKFFSIAEGKIWKHYGTDYNNLYGRLRPFYIDYKVNPEGMVDRVFTNIEFRGDSFNGKELKDTINFKALDAYNEYQKGTTTLNYKRYNISEIKKKFRVWRADIPREDGTMNRIRNPWVHLKLTSDLSTDKTILHDFTITYFE